MVYTGYKQSINMVYTGYTHGIHRVYIRMYHCTFDVLLSYGSIYACVYMYTIASRNIADWWLAYWISHTHKPLHFDDNNNQSSVAVFPELQNGSNDTNLTAAGDNLAFYLGIYGGLAAANSVRNVTLSTFILYITLWYCIIGMSNYCDSTQFIHEQIIDSLTI